MARQAIHPGEHLAEALQELNMSAEDFARKIDIPESVIIEILKGHRDITEDIALKLSQFFGMSVEFWLNLQKMYDQRIGKTP
jgi:antitoxin HigA-1